MTRKKKLIFVIVAVMLVTIASGFVLLLHAFRNMSLDWGNPHVLVSSAPVGPESFHLLRESGAGESAIYFFSILNGELKYHTLFPTGLDAIDFRSVVWSADGTVFAVCLEYSGGKHLYSAAYDFLNNQAFPIVGASTYASTDEKTLAQHELLDKLIKSRGGAVPDAGITGRESFDGADRLTWPQWSKYAAAKKVAYNRP